MLSRQQLPVRTIAKCKLCARESPLISQALELCPDCLRSDFERARPSIEKAHLEARKPFVPPRDEGGRKRSVCVNECLEAAKEAGLKNVRIGNLQLLRDY